MGIIYFASCGLSDDVIKIGYSDDPEERIKQLGLPDVKLVAMLPGDIDQEAELHERFEHLRLGSSEWFRLDHELETLVTNLRRQHKIVWLDEKIRETSSLLISPSEIVQLGAENLIKELQEKDFLFVALKKRGPKRDGGKRYNRPFGVLVLWPPPSDSLRELIKTIKI